MLNRLLVLFIAVLTASSLWLSGSTNHETGTRGAVCEVRKHSPSREQELLSGTEHFPAPIYKGVSLAGTFSWVANDYKRTYLLSAHGILGNLATNPIPHVIVREWDGCFPGELSFFSTTSYSVSSPRAPPVV